MPKEVTIKEEEIQIIENHNGIEVFQAQERAFLDTQVVTAKAYPRNDATVITKCIAIVIKSPEIAMACRYSKPIGNKMLNGPSVHLARILAQNYGNIRVQQRIKAIDQKTVIAEAVAFDMENNYAVCVEARRSIVKKDGTRYDDSTIETNAMAIMAIAERNAILKLLPKSMVDEVYNQAFSCAYGQLSDKAILIKEKSRIFSVFKYHYNISEEAVVKLVGRYTKEAVTAENVADLQGYLQALKDKEITVEDLLKKNTVKPTPEAKKVTLKKKQTTSSKKKTTPPEMP